MRHLLAIAVLAAIPAGAAPAGQKELIWRGGKWVRQEPPAKGSGAGEAALIRRAMDAGRYRSAVKGAGKFLKRYPAHPAREEVMSLAGDAELKRRRFWQAYQWYEKQLTAFPAGPLVDRALGREMTVAKAFLAGEKRIVLKTIRLSARDEGVTILHRIAERAPGTVRAEDALLTVADYYYARRNWAEAIDAYDAFLKLYPKSPRAAHAELRSAEANHNAYRGAMWDETPLLEAEQRYKAFAARYPAAAARIRARKILEDIRASRAAKQFEIGKYYRRIGKGPAARYYFRMVAKDYPGTKSARLAGKLLGPARTGGAAGKAGGNKPAKEAKP